MGRSKGREQRVARERAARERRAANAKPSAVLPATEASVKLAAALEEAGLGALAGRARRLEFDEAYSRSATPLRDLVVELTRAGQTGLIDRVVAGDFDETWADRQAYARTPAGRREQAELGALMADPELSAKALEFFGAMEANPRAGRRLLAEELARINEQVHGSVGVDDGAPVDPGDVHPHVRPLLGATGPDGQRLDTPEILAAAELCGRTGGRHFELGWVHDEAGVPEHARGWYAHALYPGGVRVGVADQPGPGAAAAAFASRLLDGGQCQHCRKLVTTDPAGAMASDRVLVDGRRWSQAEQVQAGLCEWRRVGVHWRSGCGKA